MITSGPNLERVPQFVAVGGEGGEYAGGGGADVGAQGQRVGAVQLDQAGAHQRGLKQRGSHLVTILIISKGCQ